MESFILLNDNYFLFYSYFFSLLFFIDIYMVFFFEFFKVNLRGVVDFFKIICLVFNYFIFVYMSIYVNFN